VARCLSSAGLLGAGITLLIGGVSVKGEGYFGRLERYPAHATSRASSGVTGIVYSFRQFVILR